MPGPHHAQARRKPGVPRARDCWVDEEQVADNSVAMPRIEAGRAPCNGTPTDLAANTNLRGQVAAQGAVRDLTRRRRT
ncbi:hypothetical protein AB0H86_07540 [Streptomyces sp. NPDC050997]|uniref:hypothetical protein n=1 Tax=Streptomyces sp. NPDC050997 TaxID=3155519 RepID=UPI0034349645